VWPSFSTCHPEQGILFSPESLSVSACGPPEQKDSPVAHPVSVPAFRGQSSWQTSRAGLGQCAGFFLAKQLAARDFHRKNTPYRRGFGTVQKKHPVTFCFRLATTIVFSLQCAFRVSSFLAYHSVFSPLFQSSLGVASCPFSVLESNSQVGQHVLLPPLPPGHAIFMVTLFNAVSPWGSPCFRIVS